MLIWSPVPDWSVQTGGKWALHGPRDDGRFPRHVTCKCSLDWKLEWR